MGRFKGRCAIGDAHRWNMVVQYAHGEGTKLLAYRIRLGYFGLFEADLTHAFPLTEIKGHSERIRISLDPTHARDLGLFGEHVHGDVGIALEETGLPHVLHADATCREVGHTTVRESQPCIGDIRRIADHSHATRGDLFDRTSHHVQHDIDVVDHKVENNTHIGAPGVELREAMCFDEHRVFQERTGNLERGVEPLHMADLDFQPCCFGKSHQFMRLLECVRNRFFNEHMLAAGKRLLGKGEVRKGRGHDIQCVRLCQQRLGTIHYNHPELLRDGLALFRMWIIDPDQLELGHFAQLLHMDPAKMAGTENPDPDGSVHVRSLGFRKAGGKNRRMPRGLSCAATFANVGVEAQDSYRHQGLRRKLVEQLRTKGIKAPEVLKAIGSVPRHLFIDDSAFLEMAYQDVAFPIPCGQTISQPYTVAFQTELLGVKSGMRILEVGTGSGYQTAVLCELGVRVFSIERQKPLYLQTKDRLTRSGYKANLYYGDGYQGLPREGPFDRILVTCGAPFIPEQLIAQLKVDGRLVIPVGDGDVQRMTVVVRNADGGMVSTDMGEFRFVPMLQDKTQ